MDISIVMPAYNESANIKITIQQIFSVLDKISSIDKIEIIVIDDHSCDNTFEIIKEMNDVRIKCLRLSRRCGSHIALRAGIKEVTGNIVLCISADGEDDPSCLKEMLEKYYQRANVVWALRRDRKTEPLFIRRPAELFYKLLLWLLKNEKNNIDLTRADFLLLDRLVIDAINACTERNTSIFGLVVWLGFRQDFVEYDRRARLSGSSKWTFSSRFQLAKDWIIAFSGLPLKIASSLGIAMSVLGILGAIYIIFGKVFFSKIIPSWTSIIVLMLVLGGIQLIMLGIIGEYLWRNLDESRRRPLFCIEKRLDRSEDI